MLQHLLRDYDSYVRKIHYQDTYDMNERFSKFTGKQIKLYDIEKNAVAVFNMMFDHLSKSEKHIKSSDVTRQKFGRLADLLYHYEGSYKFYLASELENGIDVCKLNLIGRCSGKCSACEVIYNKKGKWAYWRSNVARCSHREINLWEITTEWPAVNVITEEKSSGQPEEFDGSDTASELEYTIPIIQSVRSESGVSENKVQEPEYTIPMINEYEHAVQTSQLSMDEQADEFDTSENMNNGQIQSTYYYTPYHVNNMPFRFDYMAQTPITQGYESTSTELELKEINKLLDKVVAQPNKMLNKDVSHTIGIQCKNGNKCWYYKHDKCMYVHH